MAVSRGVMGDALIGNKSKVTRNLREKQNYSIQIWRITIAVTSKSFEPSSTGGRADVPNKCLGQCIYAVELGYINDYLQDGAHYTEEARASERARIFAKRAYKRELAVDAYPYDISELAKAPLDEADRWLQYKDWSLATVLVSLLPTTQMVLSSSFLLMFFQRRLVDRCFCHRSGGTY
uniref:Uncharacterized protein n=2 Tax=Salix viminalis TaxID=40686 RepID=A0A6N2KR90_SALVM